MQDNSARKAGKPEDAAQNAADSAINERLTAHLKANAIKVSQTSPAAERRLQRGVFAEAFALLGLACLMIVAFVYASLVNKEA